MSDQSQNPNNPFIKNGVQKGTSAVRVIHYETAGVELASVGDVLILAGSDQALEPFRQTQATFKVDNIQEFYEHLVSSGCRIIRELNRVPTGTNLTVQHPDGEIFEYVQHHEWHP